MSLTVGDALKAGFVYAAAASFGYQLLAAFSRDAPLRETFNPKRLRWGLAGGSLLAGVYGLLGRAAGYDWEPSGVWAVISPVLTGGAAPPDVLIPCVAGGFAVILLGFVAFCYAVYPKDPSAFQLRHPLLAETVAQAGRAIRYYTRRTGGLGYAALLVFPRDGSPPAVAELLASRGPKSSSPPRCLLLDCASAGEVNGGSGEKSDDERGAWLELARRLYAQCIVQAVECRAAGLGPPKRVRTATDAGGVILDYLHPPRPAEPDYLLFGLSQAAAEVTSRRFDDHFDMLRDALRRILPDKAALGPAFAPPDGHDLAAVVDAASAVAARLPDPPT